MPRGGSESGAGLASPSSPVPTPRKMALGIVGSSALILAACLICLVFGYVMGEQRLSNQPCFEIHSDQGIFT
jgi:hypothetical protein